MTLTPVFAENTEALSGTVVYDFQRQNGAPTVQWQGVNKFLVYQAVNGSAKIDVKFAVDTTNGKFAMQAGQIGHRLIQELSLRFL